MVRFCPLFLSVERVQQQAKAAPRAFSLLGKTTTLDPAGKRHSHSAAGVGSSALRGETGPAELSSDGIGMENQPLLKGQRGSGTEFDRGGFEHDALRPQGGVGVGGGSIGGSQSQAYSRAAVFAVFFFPALGGLLFG